MTTTALEPPVVARAFDYAPGEHIVPHAHAGGQFDYATTGIMTVTTDEGTWLVPPSRALWIPPRTTHEARHTGAVAMRTVYIAPELCRTLPPRCTVVSVTPLLRALILAAIDLGDAYVSGGAASRLVEVLLDQIRAADSMPVFLPLPSEEPLRSMLADFVATPADQRTVGSCASALGMSARTFSRMFLRETGMTFGAWRQQLRLMEGMRLLASGASVTDAATRSGYNSTSAFIAMFRKAMGAPPSQYFRRESANGAYT